MTYCPLCSLPKENILLQTELYSLISARNVYYPGYMQLVLNDHIKEMSDLKENDALLIYETLLKLEKLIRRTFSPDKLNIASLGNMVPHLHWHIIPRYTNDRHFPNSIWGEVTNPDYLPQVAIVNQEKEFTSNLEFHLSNSSNFK